jgi:hypothetical protein
MQTRVVFLLLLISFPVSFSLAQTKRLSPPTQAQCKFPDGQTVSVDYSSPGRRGRKIFGDLVPYGQVWRTGANEATTFVTTTNLIVEGKEIPAGNYTIFTIPNPDKWTLIVNKKTGEWGIPYKYEADELTRTTLSVLPLSSPVENLTIMLSQKFSGCILKIRWEKTEASGLVVEAK